MSSYPKTAMIIGAAIIGTAAGAQIQPIPEQQLANGFLGERNNQLVGHDPAPNETYADQAAAAIERRHYRRALDYLKPYRRSGDLAYHYLAGRAYVGLGDYSAARKELTTATRKNKKFLGAQLALGLMEAEHGDKAAAIKILEGLKARQGECAGLCKESASLGSSVTSIESALKLRKD